VKVVAQKSFLEIRSLDCSKVASDLGRTKTSDRHDKPAVLDVWVIEHLLGTDAADKRERSPRRAAEGLSSKILLRS
jgi:hypothetical protein